MQTSQEAVCRKIFQILLAQLIFLAIWSLVAQSSPVFVQRIYVGFDFHDFYHAAQDWFHGINPYQRPRFFTPPPSLLVAAPFAWLSYPPAVIAFFALNLTVILCSVRACARKLELSTECVNGLTWTTLLYYPVYFEIERGNLEGLILGCLCWAFCTQNKYLRSSLIALAAGLKLYPLLLIGPAIRRRQWRMAVVTLLAFALLLLLFYRQMAPFMHAVIGRGQLFRKIENISPAAIIVSIAGQRIGKLLFLLYWAGTLGLMLYQLKSSSVRDLMLPFLPWMVAFPLQVYPYGGVLLLPVLAWKLVDVNNRSLSLSDKLFFLGFLLVGLQATALSIFFAGEKAIPGGPDPNPVFHLINSLGMCVILGSLSIPAAIRKPSKTTNSRKKETESQWQPA